MAIQNSVLRKYLATQDQNKIDTAFGDFTRYFGNPAIRENIRNSKEEQFQEGFLRELFVNILGYSINPDPDYNLTTELKNIKDAKKTDGAILKDGKALAVIELKGTDTKDLEKIRDQAFNYKNNQPDCIYVITSNFEKLRFYIHNAVDHQEFNLFQLTRPEFELLWLLLQKDNLLSGIPAKIKDESLQAEEQVTKQLYADYSAFKQELWQDMVAQNPGENELILYKKSQKLLDRFLFIFFAEDKGLLPPNSINEIITQWDKLNDLDEYRPLFDRFKKYFGYLNIGRIQARKPEIHAYNGGLFAADALLDTVKISDSILKKHCRKLSEYDFDTEVDTNILGHIFEHSLNDIENVRASLEGTAIDKSKTKRKKDGVFYTPKYITKYIVENTLGRLCTEKKIELGIVDEDFAEGKRGRQKKIIQQLKGKLDAYRAWLLQLTICDPACGSGAFLNQVLEYLIAEHRYLDELESQLFGTPMVLPNVENQILENNIFGVDINEESVEIARLSLWLRTAKKGRKLSSLNSNIKVGNSLIDDPAVAGDLAFNWENEFPQVFNSSLRGTKQSGFDVVVGNPPYVRSRELFEDSEKAFYISKYKTTSYQIDLYKLFIEHSLNLLNHSGKLSFITPSVFLTNDYDVPLRKFILEKYWLRIVATSDKDIFEDASVKTVVFVIEHKTNQTDLQVGFYSINHSSFSLRSNIPQQVFIDQGYLINERIEISALPIITKLNKFKRLGEFYEIKNGIKARKELLYHNQPNDSYKQYLLGRNTNRYITSFDNFYIHYLPSNEKLYTNQAFRTPEIFEREKLLVRQILGKRIITAYDSEHYYCDQTTYLISAGKQTNLKFLLCLLNSKLLFFYFCNTMSDSKVTFPKVKRSQLLELPICIPLNLNSFVKNANRFIQLSHEFQKLIQSMIFHLQSKFSIEKPSTKLQNWPDLDFKGFLGELKKAKVQLSLSEESDWMTYFNEQKQKALALQSEINRIDAEIDGLVYELYGLTEEEIKIVEGGEG